jgi:hypothetical protein
VEYAVAYQQWVYPDWLKQLGAWADRAASARANGDLWKLTDTAIVEPLVGAAGGEIVGAALKLGLWLWGQRMLQEVRVKLRKK